MIQDYVIREEKAIINFSSMYCATPEELMKSSLFEDIISRYTDVLRRQSNPLLSFLEDNLLEGFGTLEEKLINLLRLLYTCRKEEVLQINPHLSSLLKETERVYEIVEDLYNYWRQFERYLLLSAPKHSHNSYQNIYQGQFIRTTNELKALILNVYRTICENLTGDNFRVYRQLPSGANMGLLIEEMDWDVPEEYRILAGISFVRMTVMDSPFIIYPRMNYRQGSFKELTRNPLHGKRLEREEWLCYPARVGDLRIFIFFHIDFISLGLSLSNLFDLADYKNLEGKRPDAILVFGGPPIEEKGGNLFFEDEKNKIMLGYISYKKEIDYFGYMKKMALTLHNLVMIRRRRLPVHGAMVRIHFKNKSSASIVIVGDSGAGKSESLEAFRVLAKDYISKMVIIFDDMGSIDEDLRAYGTEIGAFLRLDDLQPGFAFEEIDRSIFMNPHRTNARLILPVTRFHHIIAGEEIDYFLYANNYEDAEEDRLLHFFSTPQEALEVFNVGARLAKGTTDEKGLVKTYFANPFGAPQRREEHHRLASKMMEEMFERGTKVGEIMTRLALEGFEMEGPKRAARALFEHILEG